MGIGPKPEQIVKHTDPSGLCVVRGKSLGLDSTKGCTVQEIFSPQECASMKAGVLCLDEKPFVRETACEFIGYVIDGAVECAMSSWAYTAQSGDVMYLPASARITLSSATKAKVFFVTCPANSRNIHH
jgi:ethanolamine utilization protein EutQ (cupin superfamily)